MADDSTLRDRYHGVLVGKAVGDALGATVEFLSQDTIREKYGTHTDIIGGGWLDLTPGEVTDDTQRALCIAHSIVAQRMFDPGDIAARFVDWYRSKPKDIGNTTSHALSLLDRGIPWNEAGIRTHDALAPGDASNGSLMRCAPVALLARGNADDNSRYSRESSIITHANPLCVDSCIAMNAAVAALLDDPDADPVRIAMCATDNAEVRAALEASRSATPADLKAGGYVLDTLTAAFWAVAHHDTLEDAVIAAVNLGNDADTTGAVAGALGGAKWGLAAIPHRWLDALRPRDELTRLADQILELNEAPGNRQ
jgi:ADP-ribosyl-[dinitrogen reductase] hydrolase